MSGQQEEEKDDKERAREEQELEDEEKYDTLWFVKNINNSYPLTNPPSHGDPLRHLRKCFILINILISDLSRRVLPLNWSFV